MGATDVSDFYLGFWKCPKCHGTGRVIVLDVALRCMSCDGTGNALVDGAARAHERRLAEIDARPNKPSVVRGGRPS